MEVKISMESLASVLGKTSGEISEALKSENDELKPQEEVNKFFVSAFKDKLKGAISESRDEGFGRGKRESLTEVEKWVESEFGVSSKGDIKAQIKELHKATSENQINPDELEKSEIFQEKLSEAVNAVKEKLGQENERLTAEITNLRNSQVRAKLSDYLRSKLKDEGYVFPEQDNIANTIFNAFLSDVWNDNVSFRMAEGADLPELLDKEGRPLKDEMHNVLTLDDYALSKASNFFVKRSGDGKEVSGSSRKSGGVSSGGMVFSGREEAIKAMNRETDPERRAKIAAAIKEMKD